MNEKVATAVREKISSLYISRNISQSESVVPKIGVGTAENEPRVCLLRLPPAASAAALSYGVAQSRYSPIPNETLNSGLIDQVFY